LLSSKITAKELLSNAIPPEPPGSGSISVLIGKKPAYGLIQ
jgi:hypothetical protein